LQAHSDPLMTIFEGQLVTQRPVIGFKYDPVHAVHSPKVLTEVHES